MASRGASRRHAGHSVALVSVICPTSAARCVTKKDQFSVRDTSTVRSAVAMDICGRATVICASVRYHRSMVRSYHHRRRLPLQPRSYQTTNRPRRRRRTTTTSTRRCMRGRKWRSVVALHLRQHR
uniref:Putative secreted peptide n=1 Tax=Anopheles braziliensis TaxID=58242 RepID=A0A2M3ZNV4_9DIPT